MSKQSQQQDWRRRQGTTATLFLSEPDYGATASRLDPHLALSLLAKPNLIERQHMKILGLLSFSPLSLGKVERGGMAWNRGVKLASYSRLNIFHDAF